jgi:glucosamine--fructose-6-phosphate aminotransferase (isomerizing)
MCGIIGYVGRQPAAEILVQGLRLLEYRGYDSAGVAVLEDRGLHVEKRAGKLHALVEALAGTTLVGTTGIGHTRWATHGAPNDLNAHPHQDCSGEVVAIHNGIIENHVALRQELTERGHVLASDTDTEVIPHLVEEYLNEGVELDEAVRRSVNRLSGAAALVVMSSRAPGEIVAARVANAGGVVIGYGDGEVFLASDLPALLPHTRHVAFLSDHEIAHLSASGVRYMDARGDEVMKVQQTVPYDPVSAEKGPYKYFMLKEIAEQPVSILDTIRGRVDLLDPSLYLDGVQFTDRQLAAVRRVILIGMGTSVHAAMIGRQYIERLAGLPAEVENASEFRYRDPVLEPGTLVISISQSGETVDTLAAMELVAERGINQMTICNVEGAATTRLSGAALMTRCGPEIGVASTKTFSASVVALYLFACKLASVRGRVNSAELRILLDDLSRVPALVGRILDEQIEYETLARELASKRNVLFLGRGLQYPVAMEGALKLKEVSYLHAEGYPGGEMKHGPIALIDGDMPVIALVPNDRLYEKMLGNIEEVLARGGSVYAVGTESDELLPRKAERVLRVPAAPELLQPLLTVVPAQLLAYYVALIRGCDVDQPRNLAKTVTVE